jgi:phosphatidylethanolamine-binding protein (PEBP) family uncharacterized protein
MDAVSSALDWLLSLTEEADDFKGHDGPLAQIVPSLVPRFENDGMLDVVFGSTRVEMGANATPRQMQRQPRVTFAPVEKKALYTLVMWDPDVPLGFGAVCHWLVVNIPGSWAMQQALTVHSYAGAGPPWGASASAPAALANFRHLSCAGSGKHRYVFAVCRQLGNSALLLSDARKIKRYDCCLKDACSWLAHLLSLLHSGATLTWVRLGRR